MKNILFTIAILLTAVFSYASEPVFPVLTGPVVDNTGVLNSDQIRLLSAKLISFQKTKGSQIAVCIIPTTSPLTIEDYGIKLAEKWKIGREKEDDGIIIIVAKNDRKMRIEVGYGLEHIITDLLAGRIIDYMMAPEFRKGDFYKGIDAAADSLITFINGGDIPSISGEAVSTSSIEGVNNETEFNIGTGFIIAAILIFIILIGLGKTLLSLLFTYIPFTIGLYLIGAGMLSEAAIFGGFSMIPFAFIAVMMKFAPAGTSSGSSGYSSGYSSSSSSSYSSSSGSDSYSGGGGSFGGGGASGDW